MKKAILNYFDIKDGLIFMASVAFTTLVGYLLFGVNALMWTSFSSMFTYSLYDARPDRSNHLYVFFLMMIIMINNYIGYWLQLSWLFYVYLFAVACFFHITYGKDPVLDRAVRYIIMLSTIGTTLTSVSYELPVGYLIGTLTVLGVLFVLHLKNYDFTAFKNGLFSKELYTSEKHAIPRAFIYSIGMLLSLLIPDFLHLGRIYWAPLTFVMVLNPKAEHVFKNTIFRFAGSFLSVILLMIMLATSYNASVIILASFFVISFFLPTFLDKTPILRSFGVTFFVLSMTEIALYWNDPVYSPLFERLYETLIGGLLAIITSIVLKKIRAIQ